MPMRPPIIIITAHGDIEMAVDAMKNGAHDFLTKPIQLSQLESSIQRAVELVQMRRELAHLRQTQKESVNFIVGKSAGMKSVLSQALKGSSGASFCLDYRRNRHRQRCSGALYS